MTKTQLLKLFLTFLGILMISATGYAAWKISEDIDKSNSELSQPVVNKEAQINGNEALKSEIDTSAWKTYKNQEWDYKIRVPSDWIIRGNESQSDVYFISPELFNTEEENRQNCSKGLPGCNLDLAALGVTIHTEKVAKNALSKTLSDRLKKTKYVSEEHVKIGPSEKIMGIKVKIPSLADYTIIYLTDNHDILYKIYTEFGENLIFRIIASNFQFLGD